MLLFHYGAQLWCSNCNYGIQTYNSILEHASIVVTNDTSLVMCILGASSQDEKTHPSPPLNWDQSMMIVFAITDLWSACVTIEPGSMQTASIHFIAVKLWGGEFRAIILEHPWLRP